MGERLKSSQAFLWPADHISYVGRQLCCDYLMFSVDMVLRASWWLSLILLSCLTAVILSQPDRSAFYLRDILCTISQKNWGESGSS